MSGTTPPPAEFGTEAPPASSSRPHGVSIIVPALNEATTLGAAVQRCREAASRHFPDHEIIVIDDGSTDETGHIADALARADARVQVVHHERPRNLGFAYKAGVARARFAYVLMFPGDNEGSDEQLDAVMASAGRADIIVNYIANPEIRPWSRRVLSRGFVGLLNSLFGLRLRYYNGTVLHRTDVVRAITIHTDSFAYQAEALIKLLKAGHTYIEVGTPIAPRVEGRTKAFRLANTLAVGRAVFRLLAEVRR
jgi:glycosyltransferase involved in cell wall biosynthesis